MVLWSWRCALVYSKQKNISWCEKIYHHIVTLQSKRSFELSLQGSQDVCMLLIWGDVGLPSICQLELQFPVLSGCGRLLAASAVYLGLDEFVFSFWFVSAATSLVCHLDPTFEGTMHWIINNLSLFYWMKGRCMLVYEIETTLQAKNLQIKASKKEHFCHQIVQNTEPTSYFSRGKATQVCWSIVFPGPYVVSLQLSLVDVQPEDLAMTINWYS